MKFIVLTAPDSDPDLSVSENLRVRWFGLTEHINEHFGVMISKGGGLPLQQLERIRVMSEKQGHRLRPGDVIVLDGLVFRYDGKPPIGGFVVPSREDKATVRKIVGLSHGGA